jgi:hypothetical protein
LRELADDEIDVAVTCRVLTVSRSGYDDWLSRSASLRDQENELLVKHSKRIHAAVSIGHGDTVLRDQLIEDLDRLLPA